ncbi:MAG: restriction endonuclease subunit R [Candidatus Cloacimonadota bacterium]|nr:MAG: restriction endonuclease subunit R [Candidatus Cloacimonadota bacterium]
MNEAETRAELIDPLLKKAGWGQDAETKIFREFQITKGKIQSGGKRSRSLIADYILSFKNEKLAVIEAKSNEKSYSEGVEQAKDYAQKLHLKYAYATNGCEIYQINMQTGEEKLLNRFPGPQELRDAIHGKTIDEQDEKQLKEINKWKEEFNKVAFEDRSGTRPPRFYQEIAVNKAVYAIAEKKKRILLTLATGAGKTYIAFQIAWKLFHSRWNLSSLTYKIEEKIPVAERSLSNRRPRILFLADRNILADQAFNAFSAFPEDALIRIEPDSIRKKGKVPTNGSIFFTIFQTFMASAPLSQREEKSLATSLNSDSLSQQKHKLPAERSLIRRRLNFGEYPKDFFDLIIIDECHRGGANDESTWRGIMEHFSPAVQIGLTATPKRKDNADTYKYFGEPVYIYSLKEGINDGFLTPFKVKRIQTTIDKYIYNPDDTVLQGEVELKREYVEQDFNNIIEIKERDKKRVKIFMNDICRDEKTIVFCRTQQYAAFVRDLINQNKKSSDPNYCRRVTAEDGKLGELYLRDFQDNEKTIPTILTTSQKLSTGVDAGNIRNIILMRPVNSIIEFKQIIGRGTRLFDGKHYFTLYDFVGAYHHFLDPEWDGAPLEAAPKSGEKKRHQGNKAKPAKDRPEKIKIKLADGKMREIQHMIATSFWDLDGKPVSAEQYLKNLYGKLPAFFKSEEELRKIWSNPTTRQTLLEKLEESGFNTDDLAELQKLVNAENSDLFDVLEYVVFAVKPLSRRERVKLAKDRLPDELNRSQKDFIEFVLQQYEKQGVLEISQEKLPALLELKYGSIEDAVSDLGDIKTIKGLFKGFQKFLYEKISA